ncbi:MAG: XrtA/PEP-CTERM system histidine kinase PrsK [Sphingomonadaceae bacterium]
MLSGFTATSHALAALLYAALLLWTMRTGPDQAAGRRLLAPLAATSIWAASVAILGSGHMLALAAESMRNLAFLAFMTGMLRGVPDQRRLGGIRLVYIAVSAAIWLQIAIAAIAGLAPMSPLAAEALHITSLALGMIVAAGALLLVHNLYAQAAPETRWAIRLPAIALALLWTYDLNLYTLAYLSRDDIGDLLALRGVVLALAVPLFALAGERERAAGFQLSRAATFQSFSLLLILGYFLAMLFVTRAFELTGGHWTGIAQLAALLLMGGAALLLLPSPRTRAWLRVMVAKHFFQHRYDYRSEWLRFTGTIAAPGEDAAPLEERIVKVMAEIAEAPAGLLFLVEGDSLIAAAQWNWEGPLPAGRGDDRRFIRYLERSAHIVAFDEVRANRIGEAGEPIALPAPMRGCEAAWAGVPLIHEERLLGMVLLASPAMHRLLDWEDYDLFRVAGRQAASYLAEAQGQQALAEAQRFDEFNRRFAFIMHDIKNLVSQLDLVARNAERHAEKPEFRADMIATLKASVGKMRELLSRLAWSEMRGDREAVAVSAKEVARRVAAAKAASHPVAVTGEDALALADRDALEQALAHLVQNAIDASPPGAAVEIAVMADGREVSIRVADRGAGMSESFIRTRLFRPFVSTKQGGFGIGAYEARALVERMGGRIAVASREGEGSRFTLALPAAAAALAGEPARMCA